MDQFANELSFQHSIVQMKIDAMENSIPAVETEKVFFGKRKEVDFKNLSNTRKKKKKKTKNNDVEKIVTFKPLIGGKGPVDRNQSLDRCTKIEDYVPIYEPVPFEDEFREWCKIKFFPYQIDAIRWEYSLENDASNHTETHTGGILGDVMGLGKTISSLGVLAYDYFCAMKNGKTQPDQPTLVVAPLTLLHHWYSEAINKFGLKKEDVMIYHTTRRFRMVERASKKNHFPSLVITTYETVQNDFAKSEKGQKSFLYDRKWKRVVLDEAHIARNPKTNTFRALKKLSCVALWCVTGTPIVNYPKDFRMLSVLATPSNPLIYGSSMQEQIWRDKHLIRRTKDMLDIPPITQRDEWVEFTPEERTVYHQLESWAQLTYDQLMQSKTLTKQYQKILLVLIRLRQACDHILIQRGHTYTSALLDKVKETFGIKDIEEKYRKRKNPEQCDKEFQDPIVFSEDTCFIESKEEERARKRLKKKKRLELKKLKEQDQKQEQIQEKGQNQIQKVEQITSLDPPKEQSTENVLHKQETDTFELLKPIADEFSELETNDILKTDILNPETFQTMELETNRLNNNESGKQSIENFKFTIDDDDKYHDEKQDEDKQDEQEQEMDKQEVTDTIKEIEDTLDTSFFLPPPTIEMNDFQYSSKMIHLLKILNEINEKDPEGKTVIFSQFTTMLDVLEIMLIQKQFKVCRFDGRQQNTEIRTEIIDNFKNDPSCKVLLASLKAGGVGLNLIPARYLVLMDPWWNNSVEFQAFDRIHRIGQTKPVTIYRILVKKSIEEEVLNIQLKKSNQESCFYDSDSQRVLSVKDIHAVFTTMKYRQSQRPK